MDIKVNFGVVIFLLNWCHLCSGYDNFKIVDPGPLFPPTVGYPWPLPKSWTKESTYYRIDSDQFEFRVGNQDCDIIQEAIVRYKQIIFPKGFKIQSNDPNSMVSFVVTMGNICF